MGLLLPVIIFVKLTIYFYNFLYRLETKALLSSSPIVTNRRA